MDTCVPWDAHGGQGTTQVLSSAFSLFETGSLCGLPLCAIVPGSLVGLQTSRKSPVSNSHRYHTRARFADVYYFVQLLYASGDLNSGLPTSPTLGSLPNPRQPIQQSSRKERNVLDACGTITELEMSLQLATFI